MYRNIKTKFYLLINNCSYKDRKHSLIISEESLAIALYEMIRDICILQYRRYGLKPTAGKIAGIIVFRLSRAQIIHITDPLMHKDKALGKLNHLAAVYVGFSFIGKSVR